jgi:hypothetical protein
MLSNLVPKDVFGFHSFACPYQDPARIMKFLN